MEIADASALLLLDLPPQALAGIDLLSFTTTARFKGVKGLPPGYHFAFVGSSAAFSERHGVWFHIPIATAGAPPPLFITKWNAESETLAVETNEAERLRWRANLGGIWREGLTPYRQSAAASTTRDDDEDVAEELVDWPSLTSHISAPLLSRITRAQDAEHWCLSSASSAKRDLESIPGLRQPGEDSEAPADHELNFLPVDLKRTWRAGATGRERTDAAQDRSWALLDLVAPYGADVREVLGELQFCFLVLLTLNNFSALEQWKRLLTLLFTCRAAVASHSELFAAAIKTLTLQLQHCRLADTGLIDLADEGGSLLKDLLVRFRKGLLGLSGEGVLEVVDELDDLEEYLRTAHGWQLGGTFAKTGVLELEDGEEVRMSTTAFDAEDESGEYAPLIVDLTPEQARLLGVGGTEGGRRGQGETTLRDHKESDEDRSGEDGKSGDESEANEDLDEMDNRY